MPNSTQTLAHPHKNISTADSYTDWICPKKKKYWDKLDLNFIVLFYCKTFLPKQHEFELCNSEDSLRYFFLCFHVLIRVEFVTSRGLTVTNQTQHGHTYLSRWKWGMASVVIFICRTSIWNCSCTSVHKDNCGLRSVTRHVLQGKRNRVIYLQPLISWLVVARSWKCLMCRLCDHLCWARWLWLPCCVSIAVCCTL